MPQLLAARLLGEMSGVFVVVACFLADNFLTINYILGGGEFWSRAKTQRRDNERQRLRRSNPITSPADSCEHWQRATGTKANNNICYCLQNNCYNSACRSYVPGLFTSPAHGENFTSVMLIPLQAYMKYFTFSPKNTNVCVFARGQYLCVCVDIS